MTEPDIRAVLLDEFGAVAPEIDSAHFGNLVIALCRRLGIDIPERDHARMSATDATVAYLEARRTQAGGTP